MTILEQILAGLQTKFSGVDAAILTRIATKKAEGVTDASQVPTIVEGVGFTDVLNSYASIVGVDFVSVMIANKTYAIMPPTIHKLAGAGLFLSGFGNEETLQDIIRSINDAEKLSLALSWLVGGNDNLSDELSRGTLDELVNALCEAYSLISVENFTKLSALAKNVARLIANQK